MDEERAVSEEELEEEFVTEDPEDDGEGKFDTSHIDMPFDDFTKEDEKEKADARKRANKAINDTVQGPAGSKVQSKGTKNLKRAARLATCYVLLRTHKTKKMTKALFKRNNEMQAAEHNLEKGEGLTFGDIFAAALKKYDYEAKAGRVAALQRKLEKRQGFSQKVGSSIRGFTSAASGYARIAGMKYTADALLTGRSGGASASDIANKGSRREVPDIHDASDDPEYSMG